MGNPQYLYRGSSERVDVLRPRRQLNQRRKEDSQYAVYATSDRDIALAFALGAVPDREGGGLCTHMREGHKPVEMIYVRGHPNLGGKGYLYKLSIEGFEHVGGDQWVCRGPVTPVAILEINVDDYSHLFRYATEEDMVEINRELEESIIRREAP